MDKFMMLYVISRQFVQQLYLIHSQPIRKDGNEYEARLAKKSKLIEVTESFMQNLKKFELVEGIAVDKQLAELQKIKDGIAEG